MIGPVLSREYKFFLISKRSFLSRLCWVTRGDAELRLVLCGGVRTD